MSKRPKRTFLGMSDREGMVVLAMSIGAVCSFVLALITGKTTAPVWVVISISVVSILISASFFYNPGEGWRGEWE